MFASVLTTAKRILSRSSSAPKRSSDSKEATPATAKDKTAPMVTSTRRGPVVASTPMSSARKSKRSLEAVEVEETPTAAKKRRKAAAKDEAALDKIVLQQQPSAKENTWDAHASGKAGKLPIRRRGTSPKVVVPQSPAMTRPEMASTPQAPTADEIVPETQPKSPTPKSSQSSTEQTPTAAGKRKQAKQAKRAPSPKVVVDASEEEAEEKAAAEALAKKTHIRFGSEEPVNTEPLDTTTPAQADTPIANADEDEDSESDDEAPEEVTAASALTKAKAAEAEAARAFTAQQAKQERKRKEREGRVADEQKQKRKKEEEKAKAALPAVDRYNLPALLPDSLLEAAGDRRPATPPRFLEPSAADQKKEKLNQHIKFLERGEKRIKDVKKGSVNVRVLEQQNAHLAAKINKDTRNVREKWLKGRQTGKKQKKVEHRKVEKRAFGGGFLRGQD